MCSTKQERAACRSEIFEDLKWRHEGPEAPICRCSLVPRWLADRMTRLGAVMSEAIVHHYGRDELLRRLANPFWFQSFGAVMGMDWHSSGITTSGTGRSRSVSIGTVPDVDGLPTAAGRIRQEETRPRFRAPCPSQDRSPPPEPWENLRQSMGRSRDEPKQECDGAPKDRARKADQIEAGGDDNAEGSVHKRLNQKKPAEPPRRVIHRDGRTV
jgi:Protein of unknown function (DUF763)